MHDMPNAKAPRSFIRKLFNFIGNNFDGMHAKHVFTFLIQVLVFTHQPFEISNNMHN